MTFQPFGVGALLFSGDSRYLYSVAPDAIYKYEVKSGALAAKLGEPGFDGAAALAPDGQSIYATATIITDNAKLLTLAVLDLATDQFRRFPLGVLDEGFNPGRQLAVSADGRRLVIGVLRRENPDQDWTTMLKVLDVTNDFAELQRICGALQHVFREGDRHRRRKGQ